MFSAKTLFCAALAANLSGTRVQAQAADVPLDIDGAFEGAALTGTGFNSAGTITCNGQTVTVPKNLQVAFPAAFVGFVDFYASSGSYKGYQCQITGNYKGGTDAIAAQISISQFATTTTQGYILDTSTNGDIHVDVGGKTLTIRINDPNGVYSAGNSAAKTSIDPFFTADDQNPSITSFSGFPMCIPRSSTDALCPMSNRPDLDTKALRKGSTFQAPNPLVMAPLVKGDFITFSGYESGSQIIVYEIVVFNTQITTSGVPTYIRIEDANIGVWTADTANQEIAQTRFVGYSSEAVGSVKIQAIDYDRCTGAKNFRDIATLQIPTGAVRNKFEYRVTQPTQVKYAREYNISSTGGFKVTANNNILAGTYIMPVSEWIQPEDSVPGRAPTGHDFSQYQWLTDGLGADDKGQIWGPLDPFPQSGVTTNAAACTTTPGTGGSGSGGSGSGSGTTNPSKDTVAVVGTPSWVSSKSGTVTIQCSSSYTKNDNLVNMKVSFTTADGTTSGMSMTPAGNGIWNFSQSKVKNRPTAVTCVSDLGGIGNWPKA